MSRIDFVTNRLLKSAYIELLQPCCAARVDKLNFPNEVAAPPDDAVLAKLNRERQPKPCKR